MTKIGEYKGSPIISLLRDDEDRFPFSFGITKAKLILENIESIKAFINTNEPKNENQ